MRGLARAALIGCAFAFLSTSQWARGQALSFQVQDQILAYTSEKLSRTPAEQKLDSTLLFAMRTLTGRSAVNGIPDPIPFVQDFIAEFVAPDNTIQVTIGGDANASLLAAIAAAGGTQVQSFPRFDQVTARLPIAALLEIAGRDDVRFIGPMEQGSTSRYVPTDKQLKPLASKASGPLATGPSQGVHAHGADLAVSTGVDGTGVKICVLSNGVDSLATLQTAGQLPAVDVVAGQAGSGDEGTALLQIVHDMAPNAALGFATANGGQANFATNIVTLRNAPHNCDIIADDFSYPQEGAFQDGSVAQAVNTVKAAGAIYFSAAGNFGNLTHAASGTWEGDFVNGGASSPPLEAGAVHNFGAALYDVLNVSGRGITLQWSDPLGASANDYDLFVLNAAGTTVVAASTGVQNGTQDPVESITCSPAACPVGGRIVVILFSGATRALRVDTRSGRLQINTAGATFGHNAAASAITAAATDVANAGGGQFTGGPADPVEAFSSDGPRKMFYNPNGTAITPGNVLFATNGGTTLAKVDVTAADGVASFVAGFDPFFGTSAAVAHAAAIAGLIKSAKPSATNPQITAALLNSALDIEAVGPDRDSGVGIVMAPAGVRALLNTLVVGKSFAPNSILVSATSVLTISLQNTNTIAIKGVAFTDTYPANVVNAGSPNASISGAGCGGSLAVVPGGNALSLASGVVPAGSTCTYKVTVTGNAAGTYVDGGGAVTTPVALNSPGASASLVVVLAPAIGVAKGFVPGTIAVGAPSVLTILLTNPNAFPVTGVALVDSYPSGMVNTANASAASSCGGTVSGVNLGNSVALTGGAIPANGFCTVTVNVTTFSPGTYLNTTGVVTSVTSQNGGPASAALVATAVTIPVPTLSESALVALAGLMAMLGACRALERQRSCRGALSRRNCR